MMKKNHHEFVVGFDWLLTKENKPLLLEFNLPVEEGDDETYSKPYSFLDVSLDKILQHKLIGEFMPECTLDKNLFNEFVKNNDGRVVYKGRRGSCGERVSVLKEPDWEYDFIEKFIQPKDQKIGDKSYPYVIRDYQKIIVKGDNLSWKRENIFRKQSEIALEDSEDSNINLKLNVFSNTATKAKTTLEEEALILKKTDELMNKIKEQGMKYDWNPTQIYDGAVVGYYSGYRPPSWFGYPDYFSNIDKILKEKSVDFLLFNIVGGLSRAIKTSEYGADMILLTGSHSIKWPQFDYMLRTRYKIASGKNGEIEHMYGHNSEIFESFPSRDNIIIAAEHNLKEITDKILENYQKRQTLLKNKLLY